MVQIHIFNSGIRKEVESKIHCGTTKHFDIKDEFWEPPSSCIQERKCYFHTDKCKQTAHQGSNSALPIIRKPPHKVRIRIQPVQNEPIRTKNEQRISAALALYHFYKPKQKDGQTLTFKEFTRIFVSNGRREKISNFHHFSMQPLNGWYKTGLTVPIKKLTNHQLKAKKCHAMIKPKVTTLHQSIPAAAAATDKCKQTADQGSNPETVKTAYGRQVKPVLIPIKTENVRCQHCDHLFNSVTNLKHHMKKAHPKLLSDEKCQNLPKDFVPAPIKIKHFPFKCDICYQRFEKRTRMIKHIKSVHSSDIHRVDLSKFVIPKKFQQHHPSWSLIEL